VAANGGSIIGIWFTICPPRFMTEGDGEKVEGMSEVCEFLRNGLDFGQCRGSDYTRG
jgi:hypothetical protein